MTQVNPGFFHALNLKTELENSHGTDTSEAAQYLSRVMGRPMQEKPVELWRTYLRRYRRAQWSGYKASLEWEETRHVLLESYMVQSKPVKHCI